MSDSFDNQKKFQGFPFHLAFPRTVSNSSYLAWCPEVDLEHPYVVDERIAMDGEQLCREHAALQHQVEMLTDQLKEIEPLRDEAYVDW